MVEKESLGLFCAFVQQFQHGAIEPTLSIQCLIDAFADDEFFAFGRHLDVEDGLEEDGEVSEGIIMQQRVRVGDCPGKRSL